MARLRFLPFLLVPLLLLPAAWSGAPAMLVPAVGPEAPALMPVASVWAFNNETFSYTEGARTVTVDVPAVAWNRVVVTFRGIPDSDPWDRFFGVAVAGAEVLRGTTPRSDFTVSRDITEYASLLPPGGAADVSLFYGTWVGSVRNSVRLDFYDDPAASVTAKAPADLVLAPYAWRYFGGDGAALDAHVAFPAQAPVRAVVELSLTGHGGAEFWYLDDPAPRTFHLLVDGVEVAQLKTMPYVYALLGVSGGTIWNDVVHPAVWWTGPQALDAAGVHGGIGEIRPYRGEIPAEHLPLLAGAQDVRLVQEGPSGYWITSLVILLDE